MNFPRIKTGTGLVLLTLLFLTACQSSVYLMPTPIVMQAGKHDPFANTPESERNSEIGVAYATNRMPVGAKQSRFYTRSFDQDIRMGSAQVQIGAGGQSWEEIHRLSIEDIEKHEALLTLKQVSEEGELLEDEPITPLEDELEELFSDLNNAIENSATDDITIYVHGANNSFYRTAAQAAQYRHFTGRQAIVILYSWPSAENIVRYGTDIRHIMKTVPTFVRFVKLLATHSIARRINILAYSAGATLTTKSLAVLGQDKTQTDRDAYKKSLRLGSIYFAAPDTDFEEFVEEYRSYVDIVDSVTMTMNQYDSVLGIAMEDHRNQSEDIINISDQGRSGKSRLGKPDLDDLTPEEAKWILAQTKNSNFTVIDIDPKTIPGMKKGSHDYWYQSPWVSTDALLDLNFHALPGERGLVFRDVENMARIWFFPADYETRVDEALDRLTEKFLQNIDP